MSRRPAAIPGDDLAQRVVDAYYHRLLNRRDVGDYSDAFDDNIVVHGPDGSRTSGISSLENSVVQIASVFPDLTYRVVELARGPGVLAVRWTMCGTHTGAPFRGMLPAGARVETVGAHFFSVIDGRVAEVWDLFNPGVLIDQMRAERAASTIPER